MDASFLDRSVAGVPLLFVVLGLVEFTKAFRNSAGGQLVTGNGLFLLSLLYGLLIGGGYMIGSTRPPAPGDAWIAFVYWFGVGVYGLAVGLVACGLYDTIKNLFTKIVERVGLKGD
jgi:hypothetical protein